jgi:diacylglycerol kinase family enzyme
MPLPFQVDGDLVGDRERVHLVSVPSALDVMV